MLSYHNDPNLKIAHVARARRHVEENILAQGWLWEDGRGGSLGCHAHDLGLNPLDVTGIAAAIGWPKWLVELQSDIFNEVFEEDAFKWHIELAEAVPVGVDLKPAFHRIMVRLLRELVTIPEGCTKRSRELLEQVDSLHNAQTPRSDPRWTAAMTEAIEVEDAVRTALHAVLIAGITVETVTTGNIWALGTLARYGELAKSWYDIAWIVLEEVARR